MAIRTYDILLDSYNSTIPEPIVGRQGDKNGAVTLHVTITDHGSAVNLIGQTINLMAETAKGKAIVADNLGVTLTDAKNGKFDYAIPKALWSESGKITKAYFSLSNTDGQQTTYDLIFIVREAIDISQDKADDYIAIIDGTLRNLNAKVEDIYEAYKNGDFYKKEESDYLINYQNVQFQKQVDDVNSRVSSFVSGATPDNAELKDIRNGADGALYASAGDAVRNQDIINDGRIDSVNAQLAEFTPIVDPEFKLGVIDGNTHKPNSSSVSVKIHSKYLNLPQNNILKVELGENINGEFFYYKNGSYVKHGEPFVNVGHSDGKIDANQVILVCGYRDNTSIGSANAVNLIASNIKITDLSKTSISDSLDYIRTNIGVSKIPFVYDQNINTSAKIGDVIEIKPQFIGSYKYAIVDCSAGDFFKINGTSGVGPRLYTFVDGNNKVIANSQADAEENDLLLVAPYGASRLIINQNVENNDLDCFKLSRNMTEGLKVDYKNMVDGFSVQLGKFAVGQVVDTTPTPTINYGCITLKAKRNDRFRIHGTGGANPRVWGFLNQDNILLSMADFSTNQQDIDEVITAPTGSDKLVVNYNFKTAVYREKNYITFDDSSMNAVALGKLNDTYNSSNSEPDTLPVPVLPEDSISAFINGKDLADNLNNHLGDFAIATDKMAHCSSFKIINDKVYTAFYVNKNRLYETPTEHTSVLRIADLNDMSNVTNIELCNIGDSIKEGDIEALYDTVVLKNEQDDNLLYLLFTARIQGNYYLLNRKYNISDGSLTNIEKCQFTVNTTKVDFDVEDMKTALDSYGILYKPFSTDVSFMQQLSTRIEDGTVYYYTGIGVLDFCFIAKSKDLINWEYVSQPDFATTSKYEPSVYVIDDDAYYLCRQNSDVSSYAFLTKYNISNKKWSKPIEIPDSQSRSVFFYKNNQLYALHAPKDRNHIAILQIDQNHLDQSHDISVAQIDDMFYPFVQEYNGQLYMTITQSRQHIWFNKFELPKISSNEILNKLSDLFK